jgi:5-hydroxyisourate hydrolase-like protein (transthyretin family)
MAVANPAAPPDARRLTTHVLDTATGRPAAGLTLQLLRIEGESRTLLTTVATNTDGRCDAPLLSGEAMAPGTYEIAFEVGAYFARTAVLPRHRARALPDRAAEFGRSRSSPRAAPDLPLRLQHLSRKLRPGRLRR